MPKTRLSKEFFCDFNPSLANFGKEGKGRFLGGMEGELFDELWFPATQYKIITTRVKLLQQMPKARCGRGSSNASILDATNFF
jgi:hypothetical protein